jgi:hypothetical protein
MKPLAQKTLTTDTSTVEAVSPRDDEEIATPTVLARSRRRPLAMGGFLRGTEAKR